MSADPRPSDDRSGFLWDLPVAGEPYLRVADDVLAEFDTVSSATACAKLHEMGVTRTFIDGPRPLTGRQRTVGRATTLQFMPQREDVASGVEQEHVEKRTALWQVLERIEPGDVLVVQAFGATHSGCLGEMLVRYLKLRGGVGLVVDGRIRDSERILELELPVWCTGVTPHYASQTELFPWGMDVPVACGGVLVLPGDLVVADNDGAVVVPGHMAAAVAGAANGHESWEEFSRLRLADGGTLSRYYPLDGAAQQEYQQWRAGGGR